PVQQSLALTEKSLSAGGRNGMVRGNNDLSGAGRERKERLWPGDQGAQPQRRRGPRHAGPKQPSFYPSQQRCLHPHSHSFHTARTSARPVKLDLSITRLPSDDDSRTERSDARRFEETRVRADLGPK